jgi:hypothetical protein
MRVVKYKPNLADGTRAFFKGKQQDRRNGQHCTVFAALPNPSQRSENQWYDVRFDDQSLGRFCERYLQAVSADERSTVA